MKLISGNANRSLAEAVAKSIGIPLVEASIKRFADMEVYVEILENIRGEDMFVLQPTSFPINDNLMELLIIIDTLKRASARRITAVLPYFGYARQDRKTTPRSPISAKLVANLITVAGADRVLTIDLHSGQIQGFFDIPLDNLAASAVFAKDIAKNYVNSPENRLVIVSPDVGGVVRARILAKRVEADLAIIDKRRERPGVSEVMNIIGNVQSRDCILTDDIVDSAGTLCNAANALAAAGAKSITAYISHAVLSGKAVEKIEASALQKLVLTDSISSNETANSCTKIQRVSIAPLLADAITRISEEKSVSNLFD